MNKALFLDRDGVVNVEKNYVHKIEDFEFLDGVFDLCRRYQEDGHLVLVITNQAGISRGLYSEDDFARLSAWMVDRFRDNGVEIGNVYHCPHHPDFSGPCDCRKPAPGMIFRAREEFDLDLSQCTLLGDKESDLEAGRRAGIVKLGLVRGHRKIEGIEFEMA